MKTNNKTDRGHQKMKSETHENESYLCNFDSSIKSNVKLPFQHKPELNELIVSQLENLCIVTK